MATSELSCRLSEENCERREAFWAEWKDLTLFTRPEEGCSLHEEDVQRHETYHQQGQCQALVQHSPWLVMRMGILGRGLQEYLLPYQRMLPLPIFTPTKMGAAKEEREDAPNQLQELLALETALGGQCVERQDVAEITKQLPPVVPVSKPGALRRSLSRSLSQEAQRG
ncbi:telethonin [Hipposideros larvatus]|uniref:Telethonin n=1 Tax=Hipposideros armiger TaxID=186990 RepID=A0A8B7R1P5_HIPAR|nr:PREDICTED: telethonin [Hipposideros armiger]